VISSSFLGSLCRVIVELPDGTLVTAQMGSELVGSFAPGNTVSFRVSDQPVFAKPI
jgi:hypothetical protein